MYLMYIDESGNKNPNDSEIWYVLAGVIISEIHWKVVNEEVDNFKRALFPSANIDKLELHMHHILQKRGLFSKLNDERVKEILTQLYQLIHNLPVTIIAVAINKRELVMNYQYRDPLTDAWTFLTERFHNFLDKSCDENGVIDYGLLMIDQQTQSNDKDIRQLLRSLQSHGTGFQPIDNVIEDPISGSSQLKNALQLADAVAYCVLEYVKKDAEFISYLNIIEDVFDKGPDGQILKYGLKIFPE